MTVSDIFAQMSLGTAPESAAVANQWLDAHQRRFGLFIAGSWQQPAVDAVMIESINPANGQKLATITQATATDVTAAVAAATQALPHWQGLSGSQRARFLYAIARQIQKHARLFAVLETMDNGKPIRESRDIDIPLVIRHFYHHAGWAQIADQEFAGYAPVGVCAQIIPWNFPLLMLAWKIAPALAAGNTVVLKPAEWTSLTALLFAEICHEVGLPAGVVNIITGDGVVGAALADHPDVHKVAFTGSTMVGRKLREGTAGSGKALSLELGGKSPFIVFADADLDAAVEGVVDAVWFNQGQVCCAGTRLLLDERIAAQFTTRLTRRLHTLRVGDPLDKSIDMGAIIAERQLARIKHYVELGVAEGAQCHQSTTGMPQNGFYYPPTLLTNVYPAATVAQEEIFGPVIVSMTFRTPSEAVALANNTRYGLAGSVWSQNIDVALDIAKQIKAGVIWINCTNQFDAAAGFGGYRESGFGREGGREGMYEYLKPIARPVVHPTPSFVVPAESAPLPHVIDRTTKLYIAGKQARPDSGYSRVIRDSDGATLGEVGDGNRKDIRNAVEGARAAAASWGAMPAHGRAQILYYIAENLALRAGEFSQLIAHESGITVADAAIQVEAALQQWFTAAAWADKYDGAVHHTPNRAVVMAIPEPLGVLGIVAPDTAAFVGATALLAPALAMGNTVVLVPSPTTPLAVLELLTVFDTSDVPAGVINLVSGERSALTKTLAEHMDVDGIWAVCDGVTRTLIERSSIHNLKRTWCMADDGDAWQGMVGSEFLRHAVQWKNIWVPYGA
jgi:aldehyde dehydrogenase (NAD+)